MLLGFFPKALFFGVVKQCSGEMFHFRDIPFEYTYWYQPLDNIVFSIQNKGNKNILFFFFIYFQSCFLIYRVWFCCYESRNIIKNILVSQIDLTFQNVYVVPRRWSKSSSDKEYVKSIVFRTFRFRSRDILWKLERKKCTGNHMQICQLIHGNKRWKCYQNLINKIKQIKFNK